MATCKNHEELVQTYYDRICVKTRGEREESDCVFPFYRVCTNPKSLQIAGNKINLTAERRNNDRAESILATPSSLYYTGIPEMIPGGDSFRGDSCNLGCPSRSTSVKGRAIRK